MAPINLTAYAPKEVSNMPEQFPILQDEREVTRNLNNSLLSLKTNIIFNQRDSEILFSYMRKMYTNPNGLIDMSTQNFTAALLALKGALNFTKPPVPPRTPNPQSVLNESNDERRAREASEAAEKKALAEAEEKEQALKETIRQGDKLCERAGQNPTQAHSARACGKERMQQKWQELQRIAPPATALKLLQAHWDNNQEEIYSSVGILRRLQST
jgi:hypothetical protein